MFSQNNGSTKFLFHVTSIALQQQPHAHQHTRKAPSHCTRSKPRHNTDRPNAAYIASKVQITAQSEQTKESKIKIDYYMRVHRDTGNADTTRTELYSTHLWPRYGMSKVQYGYSNRLMPAARSYRIKHAQLQTSGQCKSARCNVKVSIAISCTYERVKQSERTSITLGMNWDHTCLQEDVELTFRYHRFGANPET